VSGALLGNGPYQCRLVEGEPVLSAYFALRRRIFCEEQGLFTDDDRDRMDEVALPIACVTVSPEKVEQVVGVVRIYEETPGTWYGGRLGVDAAYRRVGSIGRSLVWKAVTTAHGRGCRKFLAIVQPQNEAFFRRLHWRTIDQIVAHARPHVLMEADLAHYPPAFGKGATCDDAA
jgi:putative N-acetyltransferase (TIGR04045 family)